jgi:hypothetical protein
MLYAFCCQDCSCSWTRPHSPHSSRRRIVQAREKFTLCDGCLQAFQRPWGTLESTRKCWRVEPGGSECFLRRGLVLLPIPQTSCGPARCTRLGPRVLLFETVPGKFRLQPYDNRHYLENSRRRSAPLPQTSQGHEA